MTEYSSPEPEWRPRIDQRHLREATQSGFQNSYLTLLSIVSAVVIASIALNAERVLRPDSVLDTPDNVLLVYIAIGISCANVVIVWYEYSWLIRTFVWVPTPVDTLIPFLLCAFQLVATFFLGDARWWGFYTGLFVLCGSIAYVNSLAQTKKEIFEPIEPGLTIHKIFRSRYYASILITIFVGASMIGISLGIATSTILFASTYLALAGVTYLLLMWTAEEALQEMLGAYQIIKPIGELSRFRLVSHAAWHKFRIISSAGACIANQTNSEKNGCLC